MKRTILTLLAGGLVVSSVAAQDLQIVDGARVVSMTTEPDAPEFGRVFELHLTVRVAPEYLVALSETLLPNLAAEGFGEGRWQSAPAPGDSLDVLATYPVIMYAEGRVDLPSLEIRTRHAPGAPATLAGVGTLEGVDAVEIPLGALIVPELAAMADSGAALVPRPAADVLGGEWSVWLLIAFGLLTAAGVGGAASVAPRWWRATGGALLARLRRRSPKDRALRELERIRSLGLHRNGRVDDFYASSTATLREFARELDPSWNTGLTSTELLRKIEERWGDRRADPLVGVIAAAERVKFGYERPDAEAAEGDWTRIRDWVREAPES